MYPSILKINNDGPEITSTNFWETEMNERGVFYASINAGAIRLLVPTRENQFIPDMRTNAEYAAVSFCNKPTGDEFSLEILLDDGSDEPFSFHLHEAQYNRCPTPEDIGKEYLFSVWTGERSGEHFTPRKRLQLPAYFQIVPRIPWMQSLKQPPPANPTP